MAADEGSSADDRLLRRLLRSSAGYEYALDLRGLDLAHALASIDRMVERQRFRDEERHVGVELDPAKPKGGQTLFQPVGRHILSLMKRGLVRRCRPVADAEISGFEIVLPAGKAKADTKAPTDSPHS